MLRRILLIICLAIAATPATAVPQGIAEGYARSSAPAPVAPFDHIAPTGEDARP